MSDKGTARRAEDLARKSEKARSRSMRLRAHAIEVAGQLAETEEAVAETLRRLASQHPHDTSLLRPKIKAAENNAAWTRRRMNDLQAKQPYPAGRYDRRPILTSGRH